MELGKKQLEINLLKKMGVCWRKIKLYAKL